MPAPRGELLQHFGQSASRHQALPILASKIITRSPVEILKDHIQKRYEDFPGTRRAWQNLPEIPTAAEILPSINDSTVHTSGGEEAEERDGFLKESVLPVNVIDEPWGDKEQYIAAHYKLLREDGIAPLRKAVEDFKAQPGMMDSGDICIYTQVFIIGYTMSSQGPAPRIEFSHERSGKRIRWTQSKRLQQGTIVALTPRNDLFKSICRIAVVAARPIQGVTQNPPQIDLFWGDEDDVHFDPVEEYIMIESRSGYFEAYRHMLVAMQKLMTERFPFQEHLAKLSKDIGPPQYLEKQPLTNLNALVQESTKIGTEGIANQGRLLNRALSNVDVLQEWPTISDTTLDESQLQAVKRILTKKLAIIQGPPGTGKTFVSVSALKVMLDNWSPGDPPIIIAAQTNHALDQLLTQLSTSILDFETSFVRLGGRVSKENKLVCERTLYSVKEKDRDRNGGKSGSAGKSFRTCKAAQDVFAEQLLCDIKTAMTQTDNEILMLHEQGIITKEQFDSLHDPDWICAYDAELPEGIMASWLGREQCTPPPRCQPINLGFIEEEIDEDFEELEEVEAEQKKKDDDDIDTLRGKIEHFRELFTGRHTSGYSDRMLKNILKQKKNLWEVDHTIRGELYRYLRRRLKKKVLESFRQHYKSYMQAGKNRKIARWNEEYMLVERLGIKLIGCTTTGLSKYRGLLASLHPRTLLIEEAAETLEGTILAAQFESLQQLILVGDHQQLQAHCNIDTLGRAPFNLAISMFERLVTNGIEFTMLNKQRRMISEIRELLNDFYPNLQDHEAVLDREFTRKPVPGMGGRDSYWFHHIWPESKDEAGSRYNIDEAQMIANFFAYLVLNGTEPSKITVLTFYNGQRKVLTKELKLNPHLRSHAVPFKVFTVDSYQGEENDIIILSIVRSNNFAEIGFLENKNRAVVSLSRARRGMYIFGNLALLCKVREEKDDVWRSVTGKMGKSSPPRLNMTRGFPLVCSNHKNETIIEEPQDFDFINGGCTLKCIGELPCGHACSLKCHPFAHGLIHCKEPCEREVSDCDQRPPHLCTEICGNGCSCPCEIRRKKYSEEDSDWQGLEEVMGEPSAKYSKKPLPMRPYIRQSVNSQEPNSRVSQESEVSHSTIAWKNWDAVKADTALADARSKPASPVKQPTNGPVFRETHIPALIENGSRIEKPESAKTRVIPSPEHLPKNNGKGEESSNVRSRSPPGWIRGAISKRLFADFQNFPDSTTSTPTTQVCSSWLRRDPSTIFEPNLAPDSLAAASQETAAGKSAKATQPQLEDEDLISFD